MTQKRKKRVLVTAALPYSNGRLHVGHIAGAYLPSDIYVRYLRLKGHDVKFICGSDDHGVAILLAAEKAGKTPAEIASHYSKLQAEDFKGLGIEFDIYGSTSRTPCHKEVSQSVFLSVYDRGYFEKKKTKQFFDEEKNVFLPDRFVKGQCGYCQAEDQFGDQCENCGKVLDVDSLKNAVSVLTKKAAVIRETVHWFLDLTKMEKEVRTWLDKSEMRDQTRRYVSSLLETGLVKRSMTRDLTWGIPVPLEDPDAKGKVLYVWFDAPIGYISNTFELFPGHRNEGESWWQSDDTEIFHFIGEDNTIFHCVIWIAMLAASGKYHLPTGVIVNQFLNIQFPEKAEAEKISKSRGTAIWIGDYLAAGSNPDVLRYYLTCIAPEKARTVYKPEDLILRNNTDLANTLGNFINRVITFTHKHVGPVIPSYDETKIEAVDKAFIEARATAFKLVSDHLDNFAFKAAMESIMEFARECNKYFDEKAPWVTRKTDLDKTKLTLALSLNAIWFLAVVLRPFLPKSMEKLASAFPVDSKGLKWEDALVPLKVGQALGSVEILFNKIEAE